MLAHWAHVGRGAAALGAAMGIGRFAYTPILPLMTAQAAVTPQVAGQLATANYVGYLAGALAGTASSRLTRSAIAGRTSLIVLVATLAAMPFATNTIGWLAMRTIAGFTSAVVFVIAVNFLLDHLGEHSPHLPGWGFGGVGVGIALSGALALALPKADWQTAWWMAAVSAAVLSVCSWRMGGTQRPATTSAAAMEAAPRRRLDRGFAILFVCYTLEGIGYIIAGTFLVAAIRQSSSGWLGSGAWLFVGIAAAPSAALWAWLSARWSHPRLLVVALTLQAVGIALPAVVGGAPAALVGAVLFGGTFIGVSTMALGAGRRWRFPGAVALLTAGYSAGQIVGPVAVAPLLGHGFHSALIAGSLVVLAAAVAAALVRIPQGEPAR
jgi:MFS family permease